jgi:hypothetical protein
VRLCENDELHAGRLLAAADASCEANEQRDADAAVVADAITAAHRGSLYDALGSTRASDGHGGAGTAFIPAHLGVQNGPASCRPACLCTLHSDNVARGTDACLQLACQELAAPKRRVHTLDSCAAGHVGLRDNLARERAVLRAARKRQEGETRCSLRAARKRQEGETRCSLVLVRATAQAGGRAGERFLGFLMFVVRSRYQITLSYSKI